MGNEKKVTRIFQMSAGVAAQFFLIIMWSTEHGVKDTKELRQYTLNWLASKDMMERVYDTGRTEDQIVKDYVKQGLTVDDRRDEYAVSSWDARHNKRSLMGRFQRKLVRIYNILFMDNT